MTQQEMIDKVVETADEVEGSITSSYSGRGMFGKTCYGITCNSMYECIEVAASKGLKGAKTDNMGRQYIVYWPHIQAVAV